jgi:hypothetical protein
MKTIKISIASILCVLGVALSAFAQAPSVDKINVPLTDPTRPVTLKVGLLNGSITVKGSTSSKEVVVEAAIRYEEIRREKKAERREGLRLIPNTSTGLSVEEDDNTVVVSTGMRGGSTTIDVTIQTPTNTSVKLSTVNDGDIYVDNIVGELEINNTNGKVTLEKISGSAVAHALNGDVVASFVKVNSQNAMSFSSMNGKIDVSLPSDIKATVYLKSDQGEIYSDFDMVVERSATKEEENKERNKRGKYRVSFEKGMKGTINGGGMEMQFKNFNGDIYIRKAK